MPIKKKGAEETPRKVIKKTEKSDTKEKGRMAGREKITSARSERLGDMLELWLLGRTVNQIAITMDMPKQKVAYDLRSFKQEYIASLATQGIVPYGVPLQETLDEFNRPFMEKISRQNEPLTMEEMLYCAIYAATNDSVQAIKDSGLDVGLNTKETHKAVYEKNCLLRSEMMKRKKNVQEEIRRVQKEREEYREATKDRILQMHLDMIDQLNDSGSSNKHLVVKLLDQVNKMQGFYTTNVNMGTASADDVLDGQKMIMSQELPEELRDAGVEDDNYDEYDHGNVSQRHSEEDDE